MIILIKTQADLTNQRVISQMKRIMMLSLLTLLILYNATKRRVLLTKGTKRRKGFHVRVQDKDLVLSKQEKARKGTIVHMRMK